MRSLSTDACNDLIITEPIGVAALLLKSTLEIRSHMLYTTDLYGKGTMLHRFLIVD